MSAFWGLPIHCGRHICSYLNFAGSRPQRDPTGQPAREPARDGRARRDEAAGDAQPAQHRRQAHHQGQEPARRQILHPVLSDTEDCKFCMLIPAPFLERPSPSLSLLGTPCSTRLNRRAPFNDQTTFVISLLTNQI